MPVYVVAERVQYYGKDGKLDHRVAARLHPRTRSARSSRQPRRLPEDVDARPTASRRSSRSCDEQGVFFEALAEEVGKDSRRVRPHLPRRLRPAAAHPAGAGEQRPQAQLLHQVRRRSAAPCSTRCSTSTRTRAWTTSRTSASSRSSRLHELGTPVELIAAVRRQGRRT